MPVSDTSYVLIISTPSSQTEHSRVFEIIGLKCLQTFFLPPLQPLLLLQLRRLHISSFDNSVYEGLREVYKPPEDGQLCLEALAGDWTLLQETPGPITDCQLHSPSSKEQ